MSQNHCDNARVFKAFCDENRLMILSMLGRRETCACHLLEKLSISQSTLSHHMKILCESGVITGRKSGKWTHYSLNAAGAEKARLLLAQITTPGEEANYTGVCAE